MPRTQYVGKAGQLAVMSELALLGYNVAIPEMDIGDDVFAINDSTGLLSRIQVKTANSRFQERSRSFRCQFSVKAAHVENPVTPNVHYVFVGRCDNDWKFAVIERGILNHLLCTGVMGTRVETVNGDKYTVNILFFEDGTARTSTRDDATVLTQFVNNWAAWPILD